MMKRRIRRYKKMAPRSFRSKLVLSHTGISLAVILLFSTISVVSIFFTVRSNEEKTLNQLVAIINQDMNSRLGTYNNISFDLVINDIIQGSLNLPVGEQSQALRTIDAFLRPVRIGNSSIANIMILDLQGGIYSTDMMVSLPRGFQLEDTEVYRQAASGNGSLVFLTSNDVFERYATSDIQYQSRTTIHAAAIIKNYTQNKVLGILILSFRNNFFQNITYHGDVLKQTGLYLVSPDQSTIYTIAGTSAPFPQEIFERLETFENHGFFFYGRSAVDYRYNEVSRWYLFSVTDNQTLYTITNRLVWVMVVAFLACLLLSTLLSRMLSRILFSGIGELKRGMAEVERGNFNVALSTQRTDEFGQLIGNFDQMVRQIRELIFAKYEQELARREAEFHALQMQINPHFLYNTFDMLHWRLLEHGEEELGESVVSISKVLRYSISNTDQNVTLQQELNNVEDYLEVMYSINRREIDCSVQVEDAEEIWLPRLSLQPLVENAVRHGFESRSKGNRLSINGYRQRDAYCLEIQDNGLGIPHSLLEELSEEGCQGQPGRHVGIQNVRLRIQYLYGPGATVSLESEYGSGTRIRIVLPMSRRREAD